MIILGERVNPGESKTINFSFAKLYTTTHVEIPIIIERANTPGPTVLMTAGIHGDEINGVEIVRQVIARKINKPQRGTIICIPILNIFGFLNAHRDFPDGGTSIGYSLAPKMGLSQAGSVAFHKEDPSSRRLLPGFSHWGRK